MITPSSNTAALLALNTPLGRPGSALAVATALQRAWIPPDPNQSLNRPSLLASTPNQPWPGLIHAPGSSCKSNNKNKESFDFRTMAGIYNIESFRKENAEAISNLRVQAQMGKLCKIIYNTLDG